MNLEPSVIESITRHKRKVFLLKFFMVAVITLALVSSIALCFWAYRTGSSSSSGAVRSFFEPALLMMFIVIGVGTPVLFLFPLVIVKSRTPRSLFTNSRLNIREKEWLRKFRNGLQGASIAMGVRSPELVVTDIPGIAAFAFLGPRGKPSVAVTREVLRVELSVKEAEALMADQLSHVVTGDLLKSRSFQKVLFLSIPPVLGVAGVGMVLSILADMSVYTPLLVFVIYGCQIGIMIFMSRKLRQISLHNELLTDSIASKITGNPAALKNALIKLDSANLLGRVRSGFLHSPIARKEAQGKVRILDREFIVDYEAGYSIDERVRNLEAIERGNWQAIQWK